MSDQDKTMCEQDTMINLMLHVLESYLDKEKTILLSDVANYEETNVDHLNDLMDKVILHMNDRSLGFYYSYDKEKMIIRLNNCDNS